MGSCNSTVKNSPKKSNSINANTNTNSHKDNNSNDNNLNEDIRISEENNKLERKQTKDANKEITKEKKPRSFIMNLRRPPSLKRRSTTSLSGKL